MTNYTWREFTKYKNAFEYIIENRPMLIVEYGGGTSTYFINQLLDELDYGGRVITFESEQEWLDRYNEVGHNTKGSIRFAAIEFVDREKGLLRYDHSYDGLENVDFVIIDGPDYRLYPTPSNHPSNATTNLKDLVELKGEEIPYFIDGREGCVKYYKINCGYTKHVQQITKL